MGTCSQIGLGARPSSAVPSPRLTCGLYYTSCRLHPVCSTDGDAGVNCSVSGAERGLCTPFQLQPLPDVSPRDRGFYPVKHLMTRQTDFQSISRPSLGILPNKVAAFRGHGIAGILLCFLLAFTAGQRVEWYTFAEQ